MPSNNGSCQIKVQVYRSKNIDYEIITWNLKMTTAQVERNRVVLLLELGFNIRYKIEENSKTKKDSVCLVWF